MRMRLLALGVMTIMLGSTIVWSAVAAAAPQRPIAPESDVASALNLLLGGPARWPSDEAMHAQFLQHFQSAVGLGRARMVSASLRVRPDMQLTLVMRNDEDSSAQPVALRYELETLELIGIAKHDTPVAFVADSHIDRSGAQRTRPLNSFEQRALSTLRSGGETTAATTAPGRSVVGAIRATSECTSCHAGSKPGDMLGAFSYQLTRLPADK